jgi:hypothetical protein
VSGLIPYFSRTGTRRNLEMLRRAGWRLLLSPTGAWRTEGFNYCLDNGAWTAHASGERFDDRAFYACALRFGPSADFVVLPDIVMGGLGSLALSLEWINELPWCTRLLIPVQDGMGPGDVEPHLSDRVGIFVGGSDAWKESSMATWGRLSRDVDCHLHIGRVNTRRRIRMAQLAGADSIDGSSASRFANTIAFLDGAIRQQNFRLET